MQTGFNKREITNEKKGTGNEEWEMDESLRNSPLIVILRGFISGEIISL